MAMISSLPDNLLALFAPRPPLDYMPVPERKKHSSYTGIAQFTNLFEDPNEENELTQADTLYVESRERKKKRIAKTREIKQKKTIEEQLEEWNPKQQHSGDPFHTLFVARMNFETDEETLKKEFGYYGTIKSISLIRDKEGKSRGYAFIEYERERDMKTAYKQADGIRIDGKRVLVDMERARTTSSFRPRRLGGGLGKTRIAKLPKSLLPRAPEPYARPPPSNYSRGNRDSHNDRDYGTSRGQRRDYRDSRDSRDYGRNYGRRDSYGDRDRGRGRDRDRYGGGGGGGYSDRRRDRRY